MTPQEVLSCHQLTGITKFSHRGGCAYVEWPTCGCGWSDHPGRHPQHLLDALTEAGYTLAEVQS